MTPRVLLTLALLGLARYSYVLAMYYDSGHDSDESGPHHGPGPHHGFGPYHGPGHHHGPGPHHGPGGHHDFQFHHSFGPDFDHSPEDSDDSSSSSSSSSSSTSPSEDNTLSYESIKKKYSIAESSLKKFCEQNKSYVPTIIYGLEAYIIKYALPQVENLNISVKAANRLIMTEVKGQGVFKGFQDIRILPEMLNMQGASWSIEQSNLKIMLPYKVTITAGFNAVCEPDNGEVNIPGNLAPTKFTIRMYTKN